MQIDKITFTSGVLSFVAGFADTSTFVGADRLFSAHITGNLVVFAYDIVTNQISSSWIKLVSFPVFILAVGFSTLIVNDQMLPKRNAKRLLFFEGFLLVLVGVIAFFYRTQKIDSSFTGIISMLIVFALGIQNAYSRFFIKEVLAPTTVMTGNVTQLIIDITNYLKFSKQSKSEPGQRIVNGICVILPFLFGCIIGGLITKFIGLGSIVFAGILIFIAGVI